MGLRLPRFLGKPRDVDRGQYVVDEPSVFVSCPGCSWLEDISVSHTISVGGIVTPRYECPLCTFREWLSLDSWRVE